MPVATKSLNGAAAPTTAAPAGVIDVPQIQVARALIRVVGDSELITHQWSEKAKGQMRDKQQGRAANKKEPKDPQAEYEGAMYRLDDGTPGLRAISFKNCAVGAARQVQGLKMTYLRGAFHINGELVAIEGAPRMREDMVRVGMGVADLRYRPGFPEWAAVVPVTYNKNAITLEQIIHLFNVGGFSQGVGEWRPERDGPYGRFHVESVVEL